MSKLRPHLNYANVVATLALLVAVGGGTTAIAINAKAPKNSVTTRSIKPGNVTARDLGPIKTVTSSAQLSDPTADDHLWASHTFEMRCPKGSRPISGGGLAGSASAAAVQASYPSGPIWVVVVGADNGQSRTVTAAIQCLSGNAGTPKTD